MLSASEMILPEANCYDRLTTTNRFQDAATRNLGLVVIDVGTTKPKAIRKPAAMKDVIRSQVLTPLQLGSSRRKYREPATGWATRYAKGLGSSSNLSAIYGQNSSGKTPIIPLGENRDMFVPISLLNLKT
ncbi:MAG: hypothetical protein ACOVLE_02370 [Pirellula staleyi]